LTKETASSFQIYYSSKIRPPIRQTGLDPGKIQGIPDSLPENETAKTNADQPGKPKGS
jgi:hypothetical protein